MPEGTFRCQKRVLTRLSPNSRLPCEDADRLRKELVDQFLAHYYPVAPAEDLVTLLGLPLLIVALLLEFGEKRKLQRAIE